MTGLGRGGGLPRAASALSLNLLADAVSRNLAGRVSSITLAARPAPGGQGPGRSSQA